jgi:trehalose 6-phosphate phosphatase
MSRKKSPAYLFEEASLAELANFMDRPTLFAFDLDGTLAPIISEPGGIEIPAAVREEFIVLNKQATVAVITGRSRSDALKHLGILPSYLIGNHGVEGLPGWVERENEFIRMTKDWQSQLDVLLPADIRNGIAIENKGATISIHYRQTENPDAARALILHAAGRLIPQPRRIGGKYVENLLPAGAPDKGVALKVLMREAGFEKGFFAGDDETDEDVFGLADESIFTIRIGACTGSQARFYLRDQDQIPRLLHMLNTILATADS